MSKSDITDNKELIIKLYDSYNGYIISNEDKNTILANGSSPTYGTILLEGVDKLISELDSYDGVLYDLGSGVGQMVLYSSLQYPFKRCIGVELSKDRHKIAMEVKKELGASVENAEFYNDNILNIPVTDATAIYVSSLCFSDSFLAEVANKLNEELQPGTKVFSSRLISGLNANLDKEDSVQMSWEANSSIKHYTMH